MLNLSRKDEKCNEISKIDENVLKLADLKAQRREMKNMPDEVLRVFWDGAGSFHEFRRWHIAINLQVIDSQIKRIETALKREARRKNVPQDLLPLTALRRADRKFASRLIDYQKLESSKREIKLGKKTADAGLYAFSKGHAIRRCSELVVYRETESGSKMAYRERCGNPFCSTCAHFESLKRGKAISEQIVKKLATIDEPRLRRGRLVHLVLTAANVDKAADAFLVTKAWRVLQNGKRKARQDVHKVWNNLPWGIWRAEVTRNYYAGSWHGHLHIIGWADGFLIDNRARIRYAARDWRFNSVRLRKPAKTGKPRKAGWWLLMQRSWRAACKTVGLRAELNFSRAVKGAKVQHIGLVMSGKEIADGMGDFEHEKIIAAVSEAVKYTVKHTDLMGLDIENVVDLMAARHGKKLISGFGGLKVKEDEPEIENMEEEEPKSKQYEVVYRWNKALREWQETARREWSRDSRIDILIMAVSHDEWGGVMRATYGDDWEGRDNYVSTA